jgi:parvulin-like peptidyl-prolyl isomerase
LAKLEGIAAEIKAGKVSFEEAAKKYSEDPGSQNTGGDLGEWAYVGQMDPMFSKAAFATKVGEVSAPVHTQFGFHLIKITGRTDGKEPTTQEAASVEENVKNAILADIQNGIFELPLTTCPITIEK